MEQIFLERADTLPEAIAFADRQFGTDFLLLQPKLYRHPTAGMTYTLREGGQIIGLLSAYPVQWRNLRCLSIGTVCTEREHRGHGIMGRLFAFLERQVFPTYDVVTLCGRRRRYEHFGFAKAPWFAEYQFYPEAEGPSLSLFPPGQRHNADLLALWHQYGSGTERNERQMADLLTGTRHECLCLFDGKSWGYLSGQREKRRITEYCGPWPASMVINSLATLWGPGKISLISSYNHHDPVLLDQCDGFIVRCHGNVRLKGLSLHETYQLLGYGGTSPKIELPSSLFYLDGI